MTRTSRSLLLLLAAASAFAACDDAPATPKPAPDVMLIVDGIEIKVAEVERYAAVLAATAPELSRKTVHRHLLENYVLPLRLAQREFAARRAELRQQAAALADVATNVLELEQRSTQLFAKRKSITRRQVEPPVAEFAFDREKMGSVSGVLEVPHGFIVAGCYDILESAVVNEDVADLLQVGFSTHTNAEWSDWLRQTFEKIADKVTYVHPDHRESLPTWMKLP